jgi:hypothetical protein
MKKIILGDCIKEMKKMADKSVDLILTDPPYNAKNIGPNKREYSLGKMQLPLAEYKKFCRDWIKEALRVAKTYTVSKDNELSTSSLFIQIKSVNGIYTPWLASQTDLLAEDWSVVE